MRSPKRVVDEEITQRGERLGHQRIVGLLSWQEPGVLNQGHFAALHAPRDPRGVLGGCVLDERDRGAEVGFLGVRYRAE